MTHADKCTTYPRLFSQTLPHCAPDSIDDGNYGCRARARDVTNNGTNFHASFFAKQSTRSHLLSGIFVTILSIPHVDRCNFLLHVVIANSGSVLHLSRCTLRSCIFHTKYFFPPKFFGDFHQTFLMPARLMAIAFIKINSIFFCYVYVQKMKTFRRKFINDAAPCIFVNNAGELRNHSIHSRNAIRACAGEIKGVIMLIKILQLRTTVTLCKSR